MTTSTDPSTYASLATHQRSVLDPRQSFPLWPPLLRGDPVHSTDLVQYPVEVGYDTSGLSRDILATSPHRGMRRWSELLPPLVGAADLGAGDTPLLSMPDLAEFTGHEGPILIKDESQNPTWSHKDRLNYVAVSTALQAGAPGVVAASSGNHGAAAAAHAARVGLAAVVFVSAGTPASMRELLGAYGARILPVPRDRRWSFLNRTTELLGYHPVSNLTATHTGHPYAPEGYKTIAYEIAEELGGHSPAAIFIPTGYGELLFGVWKGFEELCALGAVDHVPHLIACEPAARAPLTAALRAGLPATTVPDKPTEALSIGTTVSGYRGVLAVTESKGTTVPLTDRELSEAQAALAEHGLWQELSGAAGVAGLRRFTGDQGRIDGAVVCIATSSGFKGADHSESQAEHLLTTWTEVEKAIARAPLPASRPDPQPAPAREPRTRRSVT